MDYAEIARDAERRRAELLDELDKIEGLLRSAQALAQLEHRSRGGSTPTERPRSARTSSVVEPTRVVVRQLLREAGRPLQTKELVPLVESQGIEVGGKDKVATLSARLSNSPDFRVRRGIGWWFNDQMLPTPYRVLEEAEGRAQEGEPSASAQDEEGGDTRAAALNF